MANNSSSEFAISRDEDGAASNDASQLDSAGQAILKLLQRPLVLPRPIADAHWRRRKNFQANSVPPKIGSVSYKRRFSTTVRSRNALKSGSTEFTGKLKSALLPNRKKSDGTCRGEAKAPY
jgi:hypothetical protein